MVNTLNGKNEDIARTSIMLLYNFKDKEVFDLLVGYLDICDDEELITTSLHTLNRIAEYIGSQEIVVQNNALVGVKNRNKIISENRRTLIDLFSNNEKLQNKYQYLYEIYGRVDKIKFI